MAKNSIMPIFLSDNSLVNAVPNFGTVEDIVPLVMLRKDKEQALEELRINAVCHLASGFTTTAWRSYVCDRSVGKKVPVEYYTNNKTELDELKQIKHALDMCDCIKHQVSELTILKKEDRIEDFLVDYDKEALLTELLPLSDAEFCRRLHKHKEAHHFVKDVNCAALARALKQHFSNIPAMSMITSAFNEVYIDVKPRKARKPVTRNRIN